MSTEKGLEKWKTWYFVDGKIVTYDSNSMKWNDLPTNGLILLIKYIKRDGKTVRLPLQGQDAYILTRDQWKKDPKAHTKLGAVCSEDALKQIRAQAVASKY